MKYVLMTAFNFGAWIIWYLVFMGLYPEWATLQFVLYLIGGFLTITPINIKIITASD